MNPRRFMLENSLFSETLLPEKSIPCNSFTNSTVTCESVVEDTLAAMNDIQSSGAASLISSPRNQSASEALESYLSSYFSTSQHSTGTPRYHSEHSKSVPSNFGPSNNQTASKVQRCQESQSQSWRDPPLSARTAVSSFTARDMQKTSTPRNDSYSHQNHFHSQTTCTNQKSFESPRRDINAVSEVRSEHSLNSSTSSLLSTLDKLREKLKQPSHLHSTSLAPVEPSLYPPTFAYLMTQPSNPIPTGQSPNQFGQESHKFRNDLQTSSYQSSNEQNSKWQGSGIEEKRRQFDEVTNGETEGGFSPLDFAKLAEQPVSTSGLALRPRFGRAAPLGVKKIASNSFDNAEKVKKTGNLRRSRSMNASSEKTYLKGPPKFEKCEPPQSISWDNANSPSQSEKFQHIKTNSNAENYVPEQNVDALERFKPQALKVSNSYAHSLAENESCLFKTTHKSVPVNSIQSDTVSIASLKCPTCIPKPLKKRSNSLDRKVTDKPPTNSAPSFSTFSSKYKSPVVSSSRKTAIAANYVSRSTTELSGKSREAKTESGPSNDNVDHDPNLASQFPSFTPLPEQCSPLQSPHPNAGNKKQTDSEVTGAKQVPPNAPPKLSSTSSRSDKEFKQLEASSAEAQMSSSMGSLVPKLTLPHPTGSNESYVSAFDHVPLRCSTPRSLIPSSRPLSEASTSTTSRKPAMSELESFRILASAGDSDQRHNTDVGQNFSRGSAKRQIPPLSMLSQDGHNPIDSLKFLLRDMTEVTSTTNTLADKSFAASGDNDDSYQSTVAENSIITKSTLDALKLVEGGSDQLQANVFAHLDSIRLINSSTSNLSYQNK